MAFFVMLTAIFVLKTVAILYGKDDLIRKSQSFSVFTPEDIGFSGAC